MPSLIFTPVDDGFAPRFVETGDIIRPDDGQQPISDEIDKKGVAISLVPAEKPIKKFHAKEILAYHLYKNWAFLKEVSQKSFVFELQSFILKEVSQKSFVFEVQDFIPERSLAVFEPQSFILKEVRQRSFVLELQDFNSLSWISNPSSLKLNNLPVNWVSKRMTLKPIEFQSNWIWNLNLKSFESQITWISSRYLNLKLLEHLNPKSMVDNQATWISHQLTTKLLDAPMTWQPKHVNLKPVDAQMNWHKALEPQTDGISIQRSWISNRLNLKSIESQTNDTLDFHTFFL